MAEGSSQGRRSFTAEFESEPVNEKFSSLNRVVRIAKHADRLSAARAGCTFACHSRYSERMRALLTSELRFAHQLVG